MWDFVNPAPGEIQMSHSWNSQNINISRTNPRFSLFKSAKYPFTVKVKLEGEIVKLRKRSETKRTITFYQGKKKKKAVNF